MIRTMFSDIPPSTSQAQLPLSALLSVLTRARLSG